MPKQPLWRVLVDQGFFADKDTAARWIMAGAVLVNEQRIDKPGTAVAADAEVRVKGLDMRYVGRGGYKLEGALADFHIPVTGRVALDTGASTGGFTDCLLQHGAAKVYSIDVGFGQLAGKLRNDTRVVNMEKTNIGAVLRSQLNPAPSLAALDLSYLSLQKAVPIVTVLLAEPFDLLCLVKPLFEVVDAEARRSGHLAVEAYPALLHELAQYMEHSGLHMAGVTHSHIQGHNSTDEFFFWLQSHRNHSAEVDIPAQIRQAVAMVGGRVHT